jgi:hypothetical protein
MRRMVELLKAGQLQGAKDEISSAVYEGLMGRRFSLKLGKVTENYIFSFAQPYVWTLKELGPAAKSMEGMLSADRMGAAFKKEVPLLASMEMRQMMATDYIPILQGHLTLPQVTSALRWNSVKLRMVNYLNQDSWLTRNIPKPWRDKLKGMILNERGGMSYLNAHAKVANWFYLSTLGFNTSSALQNLMQPIITTGPVVGVPAMFTGLSRTTRKLGAFFDARAGGMNAEAAMERAFPEFVKSGLDAEPLSQSIMRDALDSAWGSAMRLPIGALGGGNKWGAFKKAALFMFSSTERWNRLWSFESGLVKAEADGLVGEAARNFAASSRASAA